MNLFFRAVVVTLAVASLTVSSLAQTRVRAVVGAERTNVRAQPSHDAEILASLGKGQEVEVLGEVMPKGSKEAWTKIAMPNAVTVWVFGGSVDAKKGVVKSKELNYRAGPGRNYSVLGDLKKGDEIKVVREFDGWVQIEPPDDAIAYIASRLLKSGSTPTEPAVAAATPTPAPAPTAAPTTRPVTDAPTIVPAASLTPATPRSSPPAIPPPSIPATKPPTNAVASSPSPTVPAVAAPVSRFQTNPAPAAPSQPTTAQVATPQEVKPPTKVSSTTARPAEPTTPATLDSTTVSPKRPIPLGSPRAQADAPKKTRLKDGTNLEDAPEPRFVVRQGHVEATLSPQAPTDYELRDGFYSEGVIDYLLMEPQKALRAYSGKRVMVSGFEYRDSRWRTPVLKIENIEETP